MTAKTRSRPCVALFSPPHTLEEANVQEATFQSRRPLCSILCASILAGPAAANIRYTFTSDRGSFVYDSVSFFEGGSLSAGDLARYSGDFEDVYFGNSYILLDNAACRIADDCFDATFGLSGIFQTLGTYYASDGGAEIVISQITAGEPVPELSSWALLAIGFAGLAFARTEEFGGPPATERPIADLTLIRGPYAARPRLRFRHGRA